MKTNGSEISREKKIKVLYVEFGMGFGGAVVSLSELVSGLTQYEQVDPLVVVFQPVENVRHLFDDSISLIYFKRYLSYIEKDALSQWLNSTRLTRLVKPLFMKVYVVLDYLHDLYLSRKIERALTKFQADILHINNGFDGVAIKAAKRLNIPCVSHIRGFQEIDRLLRSSVKEVDAVIAISEAVHQSLVNQGVSSSVVQTIYNTLNMVPFDESMSFRDEIREKHGVASNDIVFSIFGRVIGWKGQVEFLEAVAMVIERCPNMQVFIVGDASDISSGYTERVKEVISANNIEDRVKLVGYQRDVNKYYAASDVIVHASIEPEPFGRVVIEGMAANKAVVAMDEAGPSEIIEHEFDGLLVEPRNTKSLSQALERIYFDNDLRHSLAREARIKISKYFTNMENAKKVINIYEKIKR